MAPRVYRIPFSTNVERVALAAGHKGVALEWVDVDAGDRSTVEAVSGQSLVPVLVDGDDVVADSPEILDWLEAKHPDPPLYPAEPAARAEAEVFVAWFNTVWKRPPNLLADELSKPEPDARTVAALSSSLARAVTIFERLLSSREYLLGAFGIADVIAFPFLKYAVFGVPEGDDELFHHILVEHQRLSAGSPIRGWVARVDARPRS